MKKFLIRLLKRSIKDMILAELRSKDTLNYIITSINTKIDIPGLNEEQESELIAKIYDAGIAAAEHSVDML
jgi:hypothetical protein